MKVCLSEEHRRKKKTDRHTTLMLKRKWRRAGVERLAMKRGYIKFRHEVKTVIIPDFIGQTCLRLRSKFSVRYEQLPVNRAIIKIMLSRMFIAQQVQLQRQSCHHSHKANGHAYKNGFSIQAYQSRTYEFSSVNTITVFADGKDSFLQASQS